MALDYRIQLSVVSDICNKIINGHACGINVSVSA